MVNGVSMNGAHSSVANVISMVSEWYLNGVCEWYLYGIFSGTSECYTIGIPLNIFL